MAFLTYVVNWIRFGVIKNVNSSTEMVTYLGSHAFQNLDIDTDRKKLNFIVNFKLGIRLTSLFLNGGGDYVSESLKARKGGLLFSCLDLAYRLRFIFLS